ncbi:MAG: hypothetical protein CMQ45_08180 [Gammaproteobacteria bacterium]|nr:hypothetical protein [Gammaproteobacteria bacterium]
MGACKDLGLKVGHHERRATCSSTMLRMTQAWKIAFCERYSDDWISSVTASALPVLGFARSSGGYDSG